MKPNKNRTCVNQTYCIINKTPLVEVGDGRKLRCPICDVIYDPDEDVEPQSRRLQRYKERMAQKYGWPSS